MTYFACKDCGLITPDVCSFCKYDAVAKAKLDERKYVLKHLGCQDDSLNKTMFSLWDCPCKVCRTIVEKELKEGGG